MRRGDGRSQERENGRGCHACLDSESSFDHWLMFVCSIEYTQGRAPLTRARVTHINHPSHRSNVIEAENETEDEDEYTSSPNKKRKNRRNKSIRVNHNRIKIPSRPPSIGISTVSKKHHNSKHDHSHHTYGSHHHQKRPHALELAQITSRSTVRNTGDDAGADVGIAAMIVVAVACALMLVVRAWDKRKEAVVMGIPESSSITTIGGSTIAARAISHYHADVFRNFEEDDGRGHRVRSFEVASII